VTPVGAAAPCEYRDEHPALRADIEHLREKVEERRAAESELFDLLRVVDQRLSRLEGRIAGYMLAGSLLAGALVFVAGRVFRA
jgi:hypothetical protein